MLLIEVGGNFDTEDGTWKKRAMQNILTLNHARSSVL